MRTRRPFTWDYLIAEICVFILWTSYITSQELVPVCENEERCLLWGETSRCYCLSPELVSQEDIEMLSCNDVSTGLSLESNAEFRVVQEWLQRTNASDVSVVTSARYDYDKLKWVWGDAAAATEVDPLVFDNTNFTSAELSQEGGGVYIILDAEIWFSPRFTLPDTGEPHYQYNIVCESDASVEAKGIHYTLYAVPVSWQVAEQACEHVQQTMVLFQNKSYFDLVTNVLRPSEPYWTGLKQLTEVTNNGGITPDDAWVSDTILENLPTLKIEEPDRCLTVLANLTWISDHCSENHTFICKGHAGKCEFADPMQGYKYVDKVQTNMRFVVLSKCLEECMMNTSCMSVAFNGPTTGSAIGICTHNAGNNMTNPEKLKNESSMTGWYHYEKTCFTGSVTYQLPFDPIASTQKSTTLGQDSVTYGISTVSNLRSTTDLSTRVSTAESSTELASDSTTTLPSKETTIELSSLSLPSTSIDPSIATSMSTSTDGATRITSLFVISSTGESVQSSIPRSNSETSALPPRERPSANNAPDFLPPSEMTTLMNNMVTVTDSDHHIDHNASANAVEDYIQPSLSITEEAHATSTASIDNSSKQAEFHRHTQPHPRFRVLDPDKRSSATGMGIIAISFLVFVIIGIVFLDLPALVRDIKRGKKNFSTLFRQLREKKRHFSTDIETVQIGLNDESNI
ncbi:unnamed protein product [Owenia fusiformis]|uniref:Uncharacterized protein n=1 Tax=Owenia fusiformis TaxID=6347 RepID=A0A8J1XRV8_OWEFU|nr:unnamed protein product [Owenia fusiformis]